MKNGLIRIVCLSKSRKVGGLCFAGKEISKNNVVGQWIRPVSSRESEEISSNECEYEDGSKPNLLDIIEIPIVRHKPTCHQCENYLIADGFYWSKEDVFQKRNLIQLCDYPEVLWGPHDSSYYGVKDRVNEFFKENLKVSLYLISPYSLTIEVQTEGEEFGNPRRKVRAQFEYNGVTYLFPITDPDVERRYYRKDNGRYPIESPEGRVFMCVSIGQPHDGYCYKFIASIIV